MLGLEAQHHEDRILSPKSRSFAVLAMRFHSCEGAVHYVFEPSSNFDGTALGKQRQALQVNEDSGFGSSESDEESILQIRKSSNCGRRDSARYNLNTLQQELFYVSRVQDRHIKWHDSVIYNEKVNDFNVMDKDTKIAVQRRMRSKLTRRCNSPRCREANRVFQLHHASVALIER